MIVTGSYLDKGAPVAGSIRTSARLSNEVLTPEYCKPGEFNPDGCLFWSADQIVYPYAGELNSIFITTRVSVYRSLPPSESCDYQTPTTVDCRIPTKASLESTKKVYFIANVENLTIQIDHAVRTQLSFSFGSSAYRTSVSDEMVGKLTNTCTSPETLEEFDENYRQAKSFGTKLDVLKLPSLLDATGCGQNFSMETLATAAGAKPGESLRSSGFVVSLPIFYTNRQSDIDSIKYSYLPALGHCFLI
jgi:hypothetical protein